MCNYCGIEHGMTGDVVCPFLKRFPEPYKSKIVFTKNEVWPQALEVSIKEPDLLPEAKGIRTKLLKYLSEKNRSWIIRGNQSA